ALGTRPRGTGLRYAAGAHGPRIFAYDSDISAGSRTRCPGTVVNLCSGRRQVQHYWSLEQLPPIAARPIEPLVDESRERLRRTLNGVLERASSPTMCLLSSGYDSRRLMLETSAIGGRLVAVTSVWPYPASAGFTIEPRVTGEICRRLGIPHRVVQAPA